MNTSFYKRIASVGDAAWTQLNATDMADYISAGLTEYSQILAQNFAVQRCYNHALRNKDKYTYPNKRSHCYLDFDIFRLYSYILQVAYYQVGIVQGLLKNIASY